jgi:hypothetical protein
MGTVTVTTVFFFLGGLNAALLLAEWLRFHYEIPSTTQMKTTWLLGYSKYHRLIAIVRLINHICKLAKLDNQNNISSAFYHSL